MKNLFAFLALFVLSNFINSQENQQQDSTKVQLLDEVLLTAIRVDATSPITHSDVTKEQLEQRNLGQDPTQVQELVTRGLEFGVLMPNLPISRLMGYHIMMPNPLGPFGWTFPIFPLRLKVFSCNVVWALQPMVLELLVRVLIY